MEIRATTPTDNKEIAAVHTAAFGPQEGPEIVALVRDLMRDDTAVPRFSLVAVDGGRLVGHILFTRARIVDPPAPVSVSLLAPLAVRPDHQRRGVGEALIRAGLERLAAAGVELVFVLGHPEYYPRCGFAPAGVQGFEATYPIPAKNADAWMVQALAEGLLGRVKGRIQCAQALDRPEYWRE